MDSWANTSGWYYWKLGTPDGQHQGPLTWEQLLALVRGGGVNPDDMVWSQQLGEWRPAGQVTGLFAPPAQQAPPAPPPQPPAPQPTQVMTPAPTAYAPPPGAAGSPGAAGYAGYAPTPRKRSKLPWILIPVIAVIVIGGALGAYFAVWYNRIDSALDNTFGEVFTQQEGEVFLEPAGSAGPEAFAGELFVPAGPPSTLAIPTTASPTTAASADAGETVSLASFSGDSPALYGGSKNKRVADKEGQLAFLERNPKKAEAFCEALNNDPTFRWSGGDKVRPEQLRDYFAELTPMMLTRDIRVTNHGYRNGRPTPRQSVLQAGQLVLVDSYGVPRVRCECGNPLASPKPTKKKPIYTGDPWPGFDPATVIVIQQTTVIIDIFVVVDVDTGETFVRPAGSDGGVDRDGPQGTTQTTATTLEPQQTTSTVGSSGPVTAAELSGVWVGTMTFTDLTFDEEIAEAAEAEGCSLALLEALIDEPLPLNMDIAVDPGGKTGTATMLLDVSTLDPEGTGEFSSEPQTFTFTIDGNKLTFNVAESDTPGTMTGTVAKRGPRLVMTGIMEIGDSTVGMTATWEVTRR